MINMLCGTKDYRTADGGGFGISLNSGSLSRENIRRIHVRAVAGLVGISPCFLFTDMVEGTKSEGELLEAVRRWWNSIPVSERKIVQ
jgi:hypothetical protein